MKYNFDEITPRENTDCFKYDFRKGYFGAEDVIPLWVADMDFKTPDFIIDGLKKRLDHPILGYGIKPASYYQSIIDWTARNHQWEIKREWIQHTPGIVPAVNMMVQTFTKPGDKVIIQTPVYHPFFWAVNYNGRQLIKNPLKLENGKFTMDFEDLKQKIDKRTKLLILCNPHNPVGRVWNKTELETLAKICLENNILVVSDEIHCDIIMPGKKHIPFATISPEINEITMTCIAASKTFNLAGLATSSVIIPNKRLKNEFYQTIDNLHIDGGNIFGILASEIAYTQGQEWHDQMVSYIYDNFLFLKDFFAKNIPQAKVYPLEGTYLVWVNFKRLGMKAEDLKQFLIHQAKIGLNDGRTFGKEGDGFFRFNIASPRPILEKALNQLNSALKF
jgi:cysteine-S-conjugate beta-lyase